MAQNLLTSFFDILFGAWDSWGSRLRSKITELVWSDLFFSFVEPSFLSSPTKYEKSKWCIICKGQGRLDPNFQVLNFKIEGTIWGQRWRLFLCIVEFR